MTPAWPLRTAQVVLVTGVAISVGACTIVPWTDATRPSPPLQSYQQSSGGVPAGYYRVNPGDSLLSVATAFGQRADDVASWNHLAPGAPVTAGQILRVAPPSAVVTGPGGVVPPAGGALAAEASTVRLMWPVRGPILSTFNAARKGIVIGGKPGDPVKASAAGRVVYAGTGMEAYGPLIIIKHDATIITAYGHNRALLVKEGDAVTQGQTIAEMGADANGSGSMQFEVRSGGKPVDPLSLLPKPGG
ncbi:peptidoglycan DD-metalloendopeptidase family protein [Paraburkholderia sp. GAS334]|uniref:peptidoglycan DD-metalloendopeptidase family protein n=1 Tax=Paraburkholderia sp. GAS334 TaxID=3035131 RepID=UPI003D1D9D1D